MRSDMMQHNISIFGIGVGGILNEEEFQNRIVSKPTMYLPVQDWPSAVCLGEKDAMVHSGRSLPIL